jgi:flagellar hook assembly protein FlgD
MNPNPVKTTGTVAFSLSATASLTVRILTAQGSLIRSLLTNDPRSAGAVSIGWDRKNSAGARVAKGTYRVPVVAVDSASQAASASAAFGVA